MEHNGVLEPLLRWTALLDTDPEPGKACTKEFKMLQIPIARNSCVESIVLPSAEKNYSNQHLSSMFCSFDDFYLEYYSPNALQIAIFSNRPRRGTTIRPLPRLDTISWKVTVTVEFPTTFSYPNFGNSRFGSPLGTYPIRVKGTFPVL